LRVQEKQKSRELRKKGWSVRAIAKETHCSKSSISRWVQDIALTSRQIEALKDSQDRGRAKAANHVNSPKHKWAVYRAGIIQKAVREVPAKTSIETLRILGTALYWAEGYNASRNSVIFANSSPEMIKVMMRFFREVCNVPGSKFRGKVCIHPHLDVVKASRFWSNISGISQRQFNKPLLAVSRASKGKRDTLPLGTFHIIISDVTCCSRIKGWIEGIKIWGE